MPLFEAYFQAVGAAGESTAAKTTTWPALRKQQTGSHFILYTYIHIHRFFVGHNVVEPLLTSR